MAASAEEMAGKVEHLQNSMIFFDISHGKITPLGAVPKIKKKIETAGPLPANLFPVDRNFGELRML